MFADSGNIANASLNRIARQTFAFFVERQMAVHAIAVAPCVFSRGTTYSQITVVPTGVNSKQ